MSKFKYTGPSSAITLIVLDKEQTPADHEVVLWHDTIVDVPEDHEAILALVHQGFLTPVFDAVAQEPVAVAEPEPKTKSKA